MHEVGCRAILPGFMPPTTPIGTTEAVGAAAVAGSSLLRIPQSRAAMVAPVHGPSHQSQWCSQELATREGPKERVGLMEQPVMGMQTV